MAGPYSDAPEIRYERHLEAAYYLTRASITIYSPIIHWHPLSVFYELPNDAHFWQTHDFTMIDASNGMILLHLPNWRQSKGVKGEILHCQMKGLPVWGLEPPTSLTFTWFRHA